MAFREWNLPTLIKVGLIAGLAQVVAGVAMYLSGVYFAPWSSFISLFVLLLCIVIGTRWYRAKCLNDKITYAQALLVGIVISVSTGLIYAIYNMISISFFYPQFLDEVARLRMAHEAARGQSPESFASLRAGVSALGIAVPNLIRLSIVGSFFSLLTSLFLKRRR